MARSADPKVEAALELLRSGKASTVSSAARVAKAPRTTVRDRWHEENGGATIQHPEDGLDVEVEPNEIPPIFLDYTDREQHLAYPLGDLHMGSPNCQLGKWREWLKWLEQTEGTSLIGTGDFLNVALKTSVSDVYEETSPVGEAKWQLVDDLRPLAEAGKIDVLIPGNHENRITKATGDCPIRDVAKALDVPYAKSAVLLVHKVGSVEYDTYLRHGSGSGRSGAQANRMEREAQITIADCYIAGHTHRQQIIRGAVFHREGDTVVRRRQVYITSGSFLSYEDYAASAGLPPADIGAPRIRFNGERKDIHVSV